MKKLVMFVMVCMALHGVCGEPVRDGTSFYNAINSLQNGLLEDQEIFVLLSDAEQMQWGIGAGRGPSDSDSLQISVLVIFINRLLDEEGKYTGILPNSDDPEIQQWINELSVLPTNHEGILKMLENPSASVRWLGLKKISFMKELPSVIMTKLEGMVRTDDYVRIVGISLPPESGQGPRSVLSLGGMAHDFKCQLREDAALILQQHGHQDITIDNHQVALRGLSYLNELVQSGKDRRSIKYALRGLEYRGLRPAPERFGEKLWKEINSERYKYPQFSELFQVWDEK